MPEGFAIFLTRLYIDLLKGFFFFFFATNNIHTLFLYHIMDKKLALFISHALLRGVTQGKAVKVIPVLLSGEYNLLQQHLTPPESSWVAQTSLAVRALYRAWTIFAALFIFFLACAL